MNRYNDLQRLLQQQGLDGWLLYDFCHSNDLAVTFLGLEKAFLTRRFAYFIPTLGEPKLLASAIEMHPFSHLIGEKRSYRSWQEWEEGLRALVEGKRVAMEYSRTIPSISKVDGGTVDLLRSFGVEVVSSATLLSTVLDASQVESHFAAAKVLDEIAATTWDFISRGNVTEYTVQQFMLKEMHAKNCITEADPICAVNDNSANPHYMPSEKESRPIHPGDFILIDLWCKQDKPRAIYGDITRVGVLSPTAKQQQVFDIVKRARDAATQCVIDHFARGEPLPGWKVDRVARDLIEKACFGDYFIHRLGHNIHMQDHGPGTNLDDLETHDERLLLPSTCFSIEPGIYLPGAFGVRLEYDLYVDPKGHVTITGGVQEELCISPGTARRGCSSCS